MREPYDPRPDYPPELDLPDDPEEVACRGYDADGTPCGADDAELVAELDAYVCGHCGWTADRATEVARIVEDLIDPENLLC